MKANQNVGQCLMPHSHRRHRHDKTVLSCLVGIRGVNWIGDKSRLLATKNIETVLCSLEMRCELSLVLSWPSFQFATWLPIVMSYLETGSRERLDKTVQSPIYWGLLKTVCDCHPLSSHRRGDETVLSSRRRRCELGISLLGLWGDVLPAERHCSWAVC